MGLGQFRFGHLRELGRIREYVLGVGIATVSAAAFASLPGGAPGGRPAESAFTAVPSDIGEFRASPGSELSGMRLASLPMRVTADTAFPADARQAAASRPAADRALFDERFNPVHGERFASFDERFTGVPRGDRGATRWAQRAAWLAPAQVRVETSYREPIRLAAVSPANDIPAEIKTPGQASAGAAPDKPLRLAYAPSNLPLTDGGNRNARTAIYDISRRIVYMPNGERLEAHSGLGEHMDDLRTFRIKNKGVTPPNVYKLTLREKLFHGVRAVRMTPTEPNKMHGRDGFLVHSYMLGPNGDSNGCVSIANYDKFLKAFDNGEVDRLVVVERLENPPSAPEPSGNWLAERIRSLFESS